VERTSFGKSHTVGSFLPFFSNEYNKQEVFALPCKNDSRYNMKDFIMTALYAHERYSRRRLLKRSNSPFFRQMLQVASTGLVRLFSAHTRHTSTIACKKPDEFATIKALEIKMNR
jgi:hypothetical protein